VVRGFHSDKNLWILLDRFSAELAVHLVNGLLKSSIHAVSDNIEERKNANLCAVYDFFFLLQEGIGASGASIDNRGHTGGQSPIRGNAEWFKVYAPFGSKPVQGSAAVADVIVNVDRKSTRLSSSHLGI